MQQVRIFKGVESELWALQDEINSWIKETGATVVQITGNIAPQSPSEKDSFAASDVLIVVLYELSDTDD